MKNLRPEIKIKGSGGIPDLIDNVVKTAFNITDEEYNFICEHATDEELDVFLTGLGNLITAPTFTEKRAALVLRNKYMNLFHSKE